MFRTVLAAVFAGIIGTAAMAAPPDDASASGGGSVAGTPQTPDAIFADALRQSVGGPALADLGEQATDRLAEGLMIIPKAPAARLLTVEEKPIPAGFLGLLLGGQGMDAPGDIRFVHSGFIDSDVALAWTPDDMLTSLRATVQRENAERVKAGLEEREVRRWIMPPAYNSETHQIAWAALILPKSAPRESDGEITFHAIGFGREGYIEVSASVSEQKADEVGRMVTNFLTGLTFRRSKAYDDTQPNDPRSVSGLAGAMGIDSFEKAESNESFWSSDAIVPVVGGVVAAIGALALLLYVQRHMRREARRS